MVESGKLKLLAQHVVNLTYRTLNARWEVLSSSFLERIESLCFWLELSCSLFFGGLFGQVSKGSGAQASGCLAPWIGSSWAGRGPWCWCGTKWPGVFQLDGFFGTWRCWEWGVVLMWCCQFVVYVFTSALFYAFPFGDVHRNFNLKKKQHVQVGTCRIHLRKHLTRRPSLHPLCLIPMLRSGGYTSEFSFWPCSCCNMFCFPRQLTADRLMKRAKTSPDEQLDGVRTGAQKMPDAEVWLFSLLIIGYWYLQICSTHTTPNKHNIPGSAHRHWTLSWWGSKKSSTSFLGSGARKSWDVLWLMWSSWFWTTRCICFATSMPTTWQIERRLD